MSMGEVESCSTLVASMRVPQLQAVLQSFNPQHSNGRKQELVQRIYNLLRDKKTSANTCQRIREITRTPSLNPSQQAMRTPFNQFQRLPQHPAYYQMRGNAQQQYANAFMPAQQQMSSNVPVVMPSRAGGRAERMQITRLPFYDVVDVVLKMSELQALSGRSGDVRSVFPFTLQPEHIPLISYRGDQPTPRYELQLRMFLFDTDIEQADDFPPNCAIKVDDNPVALPGIIPTNKPNAEQKRYSRPVDITQYIQSSRLNQNRTHKLEIDWFSDRRTWAVGIWLVYRQNANILLDRLLTTGVRRSVDETKKKIALMLDGDDDNIALDQLKISLLCPLMKTRMNIPARTKTCSHLQCFDLSNYLNMCEKRPVWKCPQCNGNAHYDNLIIDQYFMDLLKTVEHNVEEVELERDGNWKILEVACDTLSDDDDDISPAKAIKMEETSTSKSNKTAKDAEIITLDDSDDDNAPGSSEPRSRSFPFPSSVSTNFSSDAPTPPRTPLTTNGSNMSTSKSATALMSSSSGPQAKQAKMDDSRSAGGIRPSRSSSTSSSETESSQDSEHSRRRKIPASSRTASNGKSSTTPATSSSTAAKSSTKKANDAEVITLDSTDDEEEEPRPARITESTSRSNSNDQTNSNGRNGSTDDSNNSPQVNGTNGIAPKRQNGVHSDIAKRNEYFGHPITEAVEYEVADGLTQFINSVFLRDTRPSTFTAS
jgi:hypothetical protein